MPFNGKSGKFNASINAVEVGCGEKAREHWKNCRFRSRKKSLYRLSYFPADQIFQDHESRT